MREVRPVGRKDVKFLFFEKQFCCAVVTSSSISVNAGCVKIWNREVCPDGREDVYFLLIFLKKRNGTILI